MRSRLLETLRQYGAQKLGAEHDNLREALRCSLVEAVPEAARRSGQRLVAALWPFWYTRSHLSEGARGQETALAVPESDDESDRYTRANVLIGAGVLGMWRREHALSAAWVGQGQALLRPGEDPVLSAHALAMLGLAAEARSEIASATEHCEEGLTLARSVGLAWVIGWLLGHLGRLAMLRGEYECLRIAREIGDQWCAAWTLGNLGRAALDRREYQRASALFEESLVLCRELASPERPSAFMVHYLGVVAGELGHPTRAARLFSAAERLRDVTRRALSPADRGEHRRHVDAVRRALGSPLFEAAWADGQAMSFERAVEYALTAPPTPRSPAPCQESVSGVAAPLVPSPVRLMANRLPDSPLTARELEVALLLARGLTIRQVAEELVISERTASTHVTHILNKLGFSTRAQVAAWAVEQGLHPSGS